MLIPNIVYKFLCKMFNGVHFMSVSLASFSVCFLITRQLLPISLWV